jgi:hypothetical protein
MHTEKASLSSGDVHFHLDTPQANAVGYRSVINPPLSELIRKRPTRRWSYGARAVRVIWLGHLA